MTLGAIINRYPRLVRAMMWAACLSPEEAAACLRDYRDGHDYSGEAVNHYGGTKAVLTRAASARVREITRRLAQED